MTVTSLRVLKAKRCVHFSLVRYRLTSANIVARVETMSTFVRRRQLMHNDATLEWTQPSRVNLAIPFWTCEKNTTSCTCNARPMTSVFLWNMCSRWDKVESKCPGQWGGGREYRKRTDGKRRRGMGRVRGGFFSGTPCTIEKGIPRYGNNNQPPIITWATRHERTTYLLELKIAKLKFHLATINFLITNRSLVGKVGYI